LYGTVQDAGANKGVLVTTSHFGPGAHTFANGKPLELVAGSELVDLLHRHGLRGRLGSGGEGQAPVPAQRTARGSLREADDDDHNVLGMYWSGNVALDVCALVCHGNRVLDDDHFVFYNNPRTPDGTVRALVPLAPDKAAIQVSFDALPERADRLVVIAAIDPVANPAADLSGFADAGIRLLDAEGTPLGRLNVSDGRDDETALVLGSFRRRANGDWEFVTGGRGYRGGLEELVQDYGIEVE
ncbi:TerD family protein, partial [Streptomyces microflavus]